MGAFFGSSGGDGGAGGFGGNAGQIFTVGLKQSPGFSISNNAGIYSNAFFSFTSDNESKYILFVCFIKTGQNGAPGLGGSAGARSKYLNDREYPRKISKNHFIRTKAT